MQDRFRFRLWDKSISEMSYDVCVGFIKDGTFPNDWICADTTCGQITYRGDKLKDICLMQCTGLKDKNGKLIFEGDVVKQNNTIYSVNWCDGSFCFLNTNNINFLADSVTPERQIIIGNIYENPELLEVSNDH